MINHLLGLTESASAHGPEVDQLLELCHWFMLILFAGWIAYFIYVLCRFRRSRNPKADYVGVTSHTSSWLEGGVVVFEGILLIGFAIPLWAKRVNQFPDEKDAVRINVIAQQFAWNFHYPGADGIFGKRDIRLVSEDNSIGLDTADEHAKDDIVNQGEAHIPVNRPVIFHVTSKDVIHSFAIPMMRVKQDAVPGMSIPVWFKPVKTGKYEIVCTQLCGNGHYRMRGFLVVDTPANYEEWLKKQPTGGS